MKPGSLPDGREFFQVNQRTLLVVHSKEVCDGAPCVIHAPTDHHMRAWPLKWRTDRQIFERICPHGIGHPDPDQRADGTHGCDGCCSPPSPTPTTHLTRSTS